ncbi:hypothetical protein ACN47E_002662 [Coniothyrium glycines]
MHLIRTLAVLAIATVTLAAPVEIEDTTANVAMPDTGPAVAVDSSSRYRCGSMKFDDGTTQDMVSQVWGGRPSDEIVCHPIKYTRARPDKGGQWANMVAAKIDNGCTCYFYEQPCDPKKYNEVWAGWPGWDNYTSTNKHFKGWWCYESY